MEQGGQERGEFEQGGQDWGKLGQGGQEWGELMEGGFRFLVIMAASFLRIDFVTGFMYTIAISVITIATTSTT